jgi:hypothetical protein
MTFYRILDDRNRVLMGGIFSVAIAIDLIKNIDGQTTFYVIEYQQ